MSDINREDSIGPSVSAHKAENRISVMVLGHEASGKEKLVRLLIEKELNPLLGIEKRIGHQNHDYILEFYLDTGAESLAYIWDEEVRKSQAFILVFNVSSQESFAQCSLLREKIMRDKPRPNTPIFLACLSQQTTSIAHSISSNSLLSHHTNSSQAPAALLSPTSAVNLADAERFAESLGSKLYKFSSPTGTSGGSGEKENLQEIRSLTTQIIEDISDKSGIPGQEKEKLREVEILVLGDFLVGKTTLIRKLISGTFSPVYNHTTDATLYKYPLGVEGEVVLTKIWDTPGSYTGWNLRKELIKNAQGFVLVYSVTSRQSFHELKSLYKKITAIKQDQLGECVVILGNRREELERQVSYQEGEDFSYGVKCGFYEVSAKSVYDMSSPWVSLIKAIQNRMKTPEKPILGPLVLELRGVLGKEGRKKGKASPKLFTIKNGELSYSKDQFTAPKFTSPLTAGYVELGETEKTGFWFTVVLAERRLNLTATSNVERERWTRILNANFMVNDLGGSLMDEILLLMLWDIVGKKGPIPKAVEKKVLDASPLLTTGSGPSSPSSSSPVGVDETSSNKKKLSNFFSKKRPGSKK